MTSRYYIYIIVIIIEYGIRYDTEAADVNSTITGKGSPAEMLKCRLSIGTMLNKHSTVFEKSPIFQRRAYHIGAKGVVMLKYTLFVCDFFELRNSHEFLCSWLFLFC